MLHQDESEAGHGVQHQIDRADPITEPLMGGGELLQLVLIEDVVEVLPTSWMNL